MALETKTKSKVADFYNGRKLFVTGATGFMGKVLLHKLLTSCRGIQVIYVLIRPKKGVEPQKRLQSLFDAAIFESIDQSLRDKVVALEGDITLPKLGLSDEDESKVVNEVSVVFHSAATVKFDEDLSKSIAMNVQGTVSVVNLTRKIGPNLASFVHVSTAYSHSYMSNIEEKFYENQMSPDDAIDMCKKISNTILDDPDVTKKVIGKHPNTYTFTKALAEQVLQERATDLPLSIFRPSIVVASYKEPVPGWVDNLNGPTGIFAGAASGILRTMIVDRKKTADIMPVDIAINLMCVIGWKTGTTTPVDSCNNNSIPIYNCTSGQNRPFTWRDFEVVGLKHILANPLEFILWYPGGSFTLSPVVDKVNRFFLHYVPAGLADLVLYAMRKKPFLSKLVKRMFKAMAALEFFATREWTWSNTNVHNLNDELEDWDKALFNCDLRKLPDWDPFIETYILGIRHYLLKNKPSSLKSCARKLKVFYALDCLVKFFCLFLMYKFFVFIWDCAKMG